MCYVSAQSAGSIFACRIPMAGTPPATLGATPTTYAALAAAIFADIIAPDYREEVQDIVLWRRRWARIADWTEGLAHALLGAGAMLAFAASFFGSGYVSFAAGCCSTACLALLRFSIYAAHECTARNAILDRLLAAAGLGPAPGIVDPDTSGGADYRSGQGPAAGAAPQQTPAGAAAAVPGAAAAGRSTALSSVVVVAGPGGADAAPAG